jgi:hypothetical protein
MQISELKSLGGCRHYNNRSATRVRICAGVCASETSVSASQFEFVMGARICNHRYALAGCCEGFACAAISSRGGCRKS